MRKISLVALLIMFSCFVFGQSIDDIKDQIQKGQWDKAKASVESFLSKEKNATKAEGWYYKGLIYNAIAKNDQYKNLLPGGMMEALEAFKKYYELEPKALLATLEQHVRMYDIYGTFFDNAVQHFNNKEYEKAYNKFLNAYETEEYIKSKGLEYNNFTFPEFDTSLVQNIALSAFMAKKESEAAKYYQMIADRKIAKADNVDVYQYLVDYFKKKNDMVNREKYLALGRELFPEDDFWYQSELEDVDETDKKALFAKYEELGGKYPQKYVLFYNYAVEMYNYAYTGDSKPADYKDIQERIERALTNCIKANPDYTQAYFIFSRHLYNVTYDMQDAQRAIKGNSAEDQKKRADMKPAIIAKFDDLIKYAQKVYDTYDKKTDLKPVEKGNFKMTADLLATAYEYKGMKEKAEEYKKRQEEIK